jgi:hypothetical protein
MMDVMLSTTESTHTAVVLCRPLDYEKKKKKKKKRKPKKKNFDIVKITSSILYEILLLS